MRATAATLFRLIPTGLTVAALVGLAWWGHATHWTLPKASALLGPSEETGPPPAPGVRLVKTEGDLPLVVFPSVEDVKRVGLAAKPVEVRELDECVTANAVVAYDRTRLAQLAPRVAGRVAYVFKRAGDHAAKGEVLALIDADEVGRAKAEYLQEAGIAAHKVQTLARLRGSNGVLPERTIADAEAAAYEAGLRRFAAHQRLLNLGVAVDLPEERVLPPEEMARQLQFAGIPDAVVAGLDPRPRTANLIPITAPFDGVVVLQDMVLGEHERPDQPAATLAATDRMWLWLSVRKEDAARVVPGQPVEFRADGLAAPAGGQVTWISTEIDQKSRTVQARAELTNAPLPPDGRRLLADARAGSSLTATPDPAGPRGLYANMFGSGRVCVGSVPNATLVPDAAVQTLPDGDGHKTLVFVARPDGVTFEPRVVRVGRSENGATHIIDGIRAGDRVVTTGSYVLKSELLRETLSADN